MEKLVEAPRRPAAPPVVCTVGASANFFCAECPVLNLFLRNYDASDCLAGPGRPELPPHCIAPCIALLGETLLKLAPLPLGLDFHTASEKAKCAHGSSSHRNPGAQSLSHAGGSESAGERTTAATAAGSGTRGERSCRVPLSYSSHFLVPDPGTALQEALPFAERSAHVLLPVEAWPAKCRRVWSHGSGQHAAKLLVLVACIALAVATVGLAPILRTVRQCSGGSRLSRALAEHHFKRITCTESTEKDSPDPDRPPAQGAGAVSTGAAPVRR